MSDTSTLTQLGSGKTEYKLEYNPSVLERFPNSHPQNDYMITLNCPEFSSLCPKTGQPDYATIYINYIADLFCVESKALKLYLFSFRNHGEFHEDCVNRIHHDLWELLNPRYLEVLGLFLPRGGISIDPFVNRGKGSRWVEFASQRLLARNRHQLEVNNR